MSVVIGFANCSASFSSMPVTITYTGDVRICNHSPVVLGNIFDEDLYKIAESKAIDSWKTIPSFCSDCQKWETCRGGCRAASEQMGLTASAEDPIIKHYKINKSPF